jgi:hypothetical protein
MKYNGFKFNTLEHLSTNIDDPYSGIPEKYGMYQWIYWPDFDKNNISTSDLKNLLVEYSRCNFYIEEEIRGTYKFHVKIWEQGFKNNNNVFGLSDKKSVELLNHLSDRNNIISFNEFFKDLCFARPFYVGKANDLRSRLKNHFSGKSNVLPEINIRGINYQHILVGYKEIHLDQSLTPSLNTIFEEIYSRRMKPGLSIKPN